MKSFAGEFRTPLVFSAAILTGILGVGCSESVDSDAIRTKGMYAKFEALAVGDGATQITADLRVGGDDGTVVNIITGDELVATVEDTDKRLSKNGDLYKTSFGVDEDGTEIQIAFLRDDDEDAPDSHATLPDAFTLSLTNESVPRDKSATVKWTPEGSSATEIAWRVSGDCIFSDFGSTTDDGSLTLSPSEIDAKGSTEDETCDVTVVVDRIANGSLDSAFGEGGEFKAIQRRSITFTSLPEGATVPEPSVSAVPSAAPDAAPQVTADAGDAGAPVTDAEPPTETDSAVVTPDDAAVADDAALSDAGADASDAH